MTVEQVRAEIESKLADCQSGNPAREQTARRWLLSFIERVEPSQLRIFFVGMIEMTKLPGFGVKRQAAKREAKPIPYGGAEDPWNAPYS